MMEAWSPWETISPEAKLTLLIARSLVTPSYANKIEGFLAEGHLNWESFNQLAAYHELTPSAHIFLKSFPRLVSSDELRLLERYYYSNLLHLNLLQQELLKILDLFKKENIMVLPLKGAQFLLEEGVYGDLAYLRPMCDIDILIKKRDCLKSEGILESLGYKKELHGAKEEYWRNKGYHLGFVRQAQNKQFYIVEVHWDLDYKRSRPLLSRLWNRVKTIETGKNNFALLSPEDSIFSLALHQRRFGKMLLLKSACDVAVLLIKHKDGLDWDYFIAEADKGRMHTTLYFVFAQAELLFNLQIPDRLSERLKVPGYRKKLIRKFILQSTFDRRSSPNNLYLKAHFLLYDSFIEPIKAVLDVPQEQFTKFYRLPPYNMKTRIFYHLRWFYFIKGLTVILYKTAVNKIAIFCKS